MKEVPTGLETGLVLCHVETHLISIGFCGVAVLQLYRGHQVSGDSVSTYSGCYIGVLGCWFAGVWD